jgi:hypothetical protein
MPTVDPVSGDATPLPAPIVPVTPPGDVPPAKPGWNTTEFWMGILDKTLIVAAVCVPLFLKDLPPGTFMYQALAVAGIVLSYLGYTASRTVIKRAELRTQADIAVGYMRAQESQYLAQAERSRLEYARLQQ